jgi:hypothetical protein
MMHKYLVVAGLALVGTASLAAAQTSGESPAGNTSTSNPPPLAAPPSPEVMKALSQQITNSRGAAASANGVLPPMTGGGSNTGSSSAPAVALGWHYFHETNCSWYSDGTNNFFYVWPSEGGYWYTVNNLYTEVALTTSCVHGYWEALYVVDTVTGRYTETYSYNFQ